MLRATRRSPLILGIATWLAAVPPALGAECRQVNFPDQVKAAGAELVLNGLGIRKATILAVKVYVAGLYLPQRSTDPSQILENKAPWELILRFVRDVDAAKIRDAIMEGFENAVGEKIAALRPRIEAMNARIIDIKNGQYVALTNDPAKGVIIDVNGTGGGTIEGADFATALLSIWIGPKPPNRDLKTGLLGGACE